MENQIEKLIKSNGPTVIYLSIYLLRCIYYGAITNPFWVFYLPFTTVHGGLRVMNTIILIAIVYSTYDWYRTKNWENFIVINLNAYCLLCLNYSDFI